MNLDQAQEVAKSFSAHIGHLISFKTYSGANNEFGRLHKVHVTPQMTDSLGFEVLLMVEEPGGDGKRAIFARQAVGCECAVKEEPKTKGRGNGKEDI